MKKYIDELMMISSRLTSRNLFLVFFGWTILVIVWGATTIPRQSVFIDGNRYWFLGDDVMISMRYARNFADGLGLVWNQGERVEGYTNFLWVMIMSFVHYVGVSENITSFYLIAINIFLQLVLLGVFFKLIREITTKYVIAFIIASIFLIADISSMVWATSGFEVTLVAVLVTYCTYRIIHEQKSREIHLITFLFLGFIPLVRADGIVITALFLGFILLFTGVTKRNIFGSVVAMIPFISHTLFRYVYYGEFIPNTASLKLFDLKERILFGMQYSNIFLKWYWLLLLLILVQVARDLLGKKFTRPIILVGCLIYIIYVIYVGGDGIGNNRFFVPIIPLIFVLGATAVTDIFNQKIAILMAIGILLFARFSTLQINYSGEGKHLIRYSDYLVNWTPSHDGVIVGVYLNSVKSADDSLAVFPAGQAPYFSMIYSIDMLGKSDKHIAELDGAQGNRPGHNKFDAEYSMSKKPTYVYPGLYQAWPDSEDDQTELLLEMEKGNLWLYDLFTNPGFVSYCLPNPIDTDARQTLFQCKYD